MDAKTIEANKQQFIQISQKYIKRSGIEKLLEYLETTDFYTAPSSCKFHLNEPGGLCLHSINVFKTALKVYEQIVGPTINTETGIFKKPISKESLAICTLFHDLCKINFYKTCTKWRKNEFDKWESYTAFEVDDNFPLGHGEKSCILLHTFVHLTKEEMLAIRWHMGMFDMAEQGSSQRMSFYKSLTFSPLISILHVADFLSSNIMERTTEY